MSPADDVMTSQGEDGRRPPSRAWEFGVGERFVYSIKIGPIHAGTSQTEIKEIAQIDGRLCYRIVSQTTTNKAFSVFYEVDDSVESFVDVESLLSRGIRKRIREGAYRLNSNAVCDQERHIVIANGDTILVPSDVHDIVSGLYYVRTLDLQPGEIITLDTYDNKKLYSSNVHILKKERVMVKAGTFDCIVVEPVLLQSAGLFQRKGKLTMWLTDDRHKLPVLMKSEIAIGTVAVELIEYTPGIPENDR